MKNYLLLLLLSVFFLAVFPACSLVSTSFPTPTPAPPLLTAMEIYQDPSSYVGQLVSLRGYGIAEAAMPLCPGYVGMDTRMVFIDEQQENITAKLATSMELAARSGTLRLFLGYVRNFSGDLGCPGNVSNVTIPYFEIIEVR